MQKELFILLNTRMDKGDLVIELGHEDSPFFTDESRNAKLVLRLIKPDQSDPKKIKQVLHGYIAFDINRKLTRVIIKFENEWGDVLELSGSKLVESKEGYSLKELMEALKEWRSRYEETNDLLNVSEKRRADLLKFCEKEIEIAQTKQSQASWLGEPNKSKLAAKIEILRKIKQFAQ